MKPTPFQILKHLAGTNCRDCGFETCLALATSVYAYGPAALAKCPHLDRAVAEKIAAMFGGPGDSKPATMIAMWEEFRTHLKELPWDRLGGLEGFRRQPGEPAVAFNSLGAEIRVTAEDIWRDGAPIDEHDKILIYYYLKNAEKLSGTYAFAEYRSFYAKLKVRDVKQEEFEVKLQTAVVNDTAKLDAAVQALGGAPSDEYRDVYDYSCRLFMFPRMPVLVLYRVGDDEFPPFCKFMFDTGCSLCFDTEGLEHLAGSLTEKLIERMHRPA